MSFVPSHNHTTQQISTWSFGAFYARYIASTCIHLQDYGPDPLKSHGAIEYVRVAEIERM